jgi:hypothetical protein
MDSLTPKDAYKAMFIYLEQYYHEISEPKEYGDILRRMSWQDDDTTTDQMMWEIWLEAVAKAKSGEVGKLYMKLHRPGREDWYP